MRRIDPDTKLFVSLSARASGNGVYFYNALFDAMDVNAVYLSTPTSTLSNLRESLAFFGVQGAAIASPFKKEILGHVDQLTDVASMTGSANCIRRMEHGGWLAHNTDEVGLRKVLSRDWSPKNSQPEVVIFGSGGVVPSVVGALRQVAPDCHIWLQARNSDIGRRLAGDLYLRQLEATSSQPCDLFINATPTALTATDSILQLSRLARAVFDLQPIQELHPFEMRARARGQIVLRGFDFYLVQLSELFHFFTGLNPSSDLLQDIVARRSH